MPGRNQPVGRRATLLGMGASLLAARPRAQPALVQRASEWAAANLPNSTPAIVQAAAAEGKLTLLLLHTGDEGAVDAMIKRFNEHYPFIDVAYTMQVTTQIMNRFNAELNAKQGITDFLHLPTNLTETQRYIAAGAVAQFVVSQDAAYPEPAKRNGLWYAWLQEHPLTVYRADALSEAEKQLIRTYRGLGDPRFKGRLGINNIVNSVAVTGAYVLQNDPDPTLWANLMANKPKVKPASAGLMDGLLSGEYDVATFGAFSTASSAARSGAPLEFGISAPSPTLYTPGGISALAPHPNAAKLWQDWATSKEGQDLWSSAMGSISARPDVVGAWAQQQPWFFNDRSTLKPIDWADLTQKQAAVVARFRKDLSAT